MLEPVRDSWNSGRPLHWTRVNDLPQFVYFDHSIHVSKGVSCNVCHGPIQEMALTRKAHEFPMVWCLECHRHPEKYLAQTSAELTPRQQVFDLYWKLESSKPLTVDEQRWADGDNLPKVNEANGRRLVKAEAIHTAELADCSICHR